MDQMPQSTDAFANSNLFADSHPQFNAYDSLFPNGTAEQSSFDASWGLNASVNPPNYPLQSRASQSSAPTWPQHANHLSTSSAHANTNAGQGSPYDARSLSHSPVPYAQNALHAYGGAQNFGYRGPQYDPSLVAPQGFNQNYNYSGNNFDQANVGTIAPQALQNDGRSSAFARNLYETPKAGFGANINPTPSSLSVPVNQKALAAAIPQSSNGGLFSIINFDNLAKATKSERMGNFLNVGAEALSWDINRPVPPPYVPRKSRNDLRRLAGNDPKLLARLGAKAMKKERTLAPVWQPPAKDSTTSAEKIKYEGGYSSEEESSSDDDDESSYTSDDSTEPSPLPATRPDNPRDAVEYDTIKALWRSKRKGVDAESIRKGLVDFWEIVKTIRDRWKADTTAVTVAEDKKRTNELPLLRSRVKDQRDMIESAFRTAVKHGSRTIMELLAENVPMMYLCYQFLLDRHKAEDYNGPVTRVMLEAMTLFTTLTDDKLEKTHLVKVLPRYAKAGDAKTQGYAKRIIANAATASKDKPSEPTAKKAVAGDQPAAPSTKRANAEAGAGLKRSASTAAEGGAVKKVAVEGLKAKPTMAPPKASGLVKKSTLSSESKVVAAPNATTAKPKQVVAKPAGLFSSLQSAAKKPGTSNSDKAAQSRSSIGGLKSSEKSAGAVTATAPQSTFSFQETMAKLTGQKQEKPAPKPEKQLPPETPEEKARRLHKESRRHLHVSFKPAEELVDIRYFTHDPDEELGHDSSQVRDVGDVGGEGRMFKQQHQMMDIDEEDEEEQEQKLIQWRQPQEIDFSVVPDEEREKNFKPYGGGKQSPDSKEYAAREYYEANNLIVFYTEPKDIPPNPREPADPYTGETQDSVVAFGLPQGKNGESDFDQRAKQRKAAHGLQSKSAHEFTPPNPASAMPDLSKLSALFGNNPNSQAMQQAPPQAALASNEKLMDILASLRQSTPSQQAPTPPQPPAMSAYGSTYSGVPPSVPNVLPQQPPMQSSAPPAFDIAAILRQVQGSQAAPGPAPQMGGFGGPSNIPGSTSFPQMSQQPTDQTNTSNQWGGNERGPNRLTLAERLDPAKNPYVKTRVCKFWQEGTCKKGDLCSYKHEED